MSTTPQTTLQLARQGNPDAIAALMNRHLEAQNITAQVVQRNDSLHVSLDSHQVPSQSDLVAYIKKGIVGLELVHIHHLTVSARQPGGEGYAWSEDIPLPSLAAPASDELDLALEASASEAENPELENLHDLDSLLDGHELALDLDLDDGDVLSGSDADFDLDFADFDDSLTLGFTDTTDNFDPGGGAQDSDLEFDLDLSETANLDFDPGFGTTNAATDLDLGLDAAEETPPASLDFDLAFGSEPDTDLDLDLGTAAEDNMADLLNLGEASGTDDLGFELYPSEPDAATPDVSDNIDFDLDFADIFPTAAGEANPGFAALQEKDNFPGDLDLGSDPGAADLDLFLELDGEPAVAEDTDLGDWASPGVFAEPAAPETAHPDDLRTEAQAAPPAGEPFVDDDEALGEGFDFPHLDDAAPPKDAGQAIAADLEAMGLADIDLTEANFEDLELDFAPLEAEGLTTQEFDLEAIAAPETFPPLAPEPELGDVSLDSLVADDGSAFEDLGAGEAFDLASGTNAWAAAEPEAPPTARSSFDGGEADFPLAEAASPPWEEAALDPGFVPAPEVEPEFEPAFDPNLVLESPDELASDDLAATSTPPEDYPEDYSGETYEDAAANWPESAASPRLEAVDEFTFDSTMELDATVAGDLVPLGLEGDSAFPNDLSFESSDEDLAFESIELAAEETLGAGFSSAGLAADLEGNHSPDEAPNDGGFDASLFGGGAEANNGYLNSYGDGRSSAADDLPAADDFLREVAADPSTHVSLSPDQFDADGSVRSAGGSGLPMRLLLGLGLGALLLLLAGLLLNGLLGRSRQPAPGAGPAVTEPASPGATGADPGGEPAPEADIFRDAVNAAQSAANQTQTASTSAEWQAVADSWARAIALMQQVPQSDPNYAVAQQKALEYQPNFNYAQQNAERRR